MAWSITTCRMSALSSGIPPATATGSRLSCSASSKACRFNAGGRSHDDYQEGDRAPDGASGHRRDDGLAAARWYGAGALGARPDTSRAETAVRVHLCAARLDHARVDAGAGGRGLRILVDPQAARIVPERPHSPHQPVQLRRERALGQLGDVAERDISLEGEPAEA